MKGWCLGTVKEKWFREFLPGHAPRRLWNVNTETIEDLNSMADCCMNQRDILDSVEVFVAGIN